MREMMRRNISGLERPRSDRVMVIVLDGRPHEHNKPAFVFPLPRLQRSNAMMR